MLLHGAVLDKGLLSSALQQSFLKKFNVSTLTRLSVTVTQRYTLGQMSVRTKSAFLRPYMFCAYCASSMRLIQQQLFTNCCLPTQPSPQGQTICSAASRTSASASRWLLAGALHLQHHRQHYRRQDARLRLVPTVHHRRQYWQPRTLTTLTAWDCCPPPAARPTSPSAPSLASAAVAQAPSALAV